MNLLRIFQRKQKEAKQPHETKNSWIIDDSDTELFMGILHYCPMCDKLEYCKNEEEPLCDFHSSYGVHFDCLPKLFGVPFFKFDSDEFRSILAYRVFIDLHGITSSYPVYWNHMGIKK